MVPNINDADRKLDFFVNIAVMQILAILQTIAGLAGFTGDEYIVFFTRLITRMHSSVANPSVASPASVNETSSGSAAASLSGATSSDSISPQSGDRLGFSSELSSAPSPMDTSASLSFSTVTASHAPVASTTVLEPQTTLHADITSEFTSTSSNDISASEPEVTLAASPRITTEVTEAVIPLTASSSSATPTDDRSLCLTSPVPSNPTRRRPRPLRREGACIFQDVAGQVVPVPFPLPAAPTIVPYVPAPIFFPPAPITASALDPVSSATIPVSSASDTASHPLTHGKPVSASSAPSPASPKRSWDEVDFDDDENEAASSSCSSASPPKRRRS